MTANEDFDLGLEVPSGLDLHRLFPRDRLLRLHPHWFVNDFKREGNSFSAMITDYVTEKTSPLSGTLVFHSSDKELMRITLSEPDPLTIAFINPGNRLSARISSEKDKIEESDPILLWVRGIREYIRLYLKTSPVTLFFRFLMERMILQMNPSQRKISMMIMKITAVEVLVIVLIVVSYVFFVL